MDLDDVTRGGDNVTATEQMSKCYSALLSVELVPEDEWCSAYTRESFAVWDSATNDWRDAVKVGENALILVWLFGVGHLREEFGEYRQFGSLELYLGASDNFLDMALYVVVTFATSLRIFCGLLGVHPSFEFVFTRTAVNAIDQIVLTTHVMLSIAFAFLCWRFLRMVVADR